MTEMMKLLALFTAILCVSAHNVREEMLQSNRPSKLSALSHSTTCMECESFIRLIDVYSQSPANMEFAKSSVASFCHQSFPDMDHRHACLQLSQNLHVVAAKLRRLRENPSKVCASLSLCGREASPWAGLAFAAIKRHALNFRLSNAEDQVVCEGCVLAVGELKSLWSDASNQAKVEDGIKSLCSKTNSFADECRNLVDNYWPNIVQGINSELEDPKTICTKAKLCDAQTRLVPHSSNHLRSPALPNFARIIKGSKSNTGCSVCTYAFALIQTLLLDGPVLGDIAAQIETKIESILPQAYVAPVQDFLSIYLQPVLNLLVRQITPKQACVELQACDKTTATQLFNVGQPIACEGCKELMQELASELIKSDVQRQVVDELTKICSFVPGTYADKCDDVVKENSPIVIAAIIKGLVPDTLCPKLHLCPAAKLIGRLPNVDSIQDERLY